MTVDLSTIMCAHNEMRRIQQALDDPWAFLAGRSDSFEVIILDNGPSDGTREWLDNVDSPATRVGFELVVRVMRLGHRIAESRVQYFSRTKAQGKKLRAWRDGLMALRVILWDRFVPRSRVVPGRRRWASAVDSSQ